MVDNNIQTTLDALYDRLKVESDQTQRSLAAHEAGHAVLSLHWGQDVRWVGITPFAATDINLDPLAWENSLTVAAGGEAGEWEAGCHVGWGKVLDYACHRALILGARDERSNEEMAWRLKMERVVGDEYANDPAWLASVKRARAVLLWRREQHRAIMDALLCKGSLKRDEVIALMKGTGPGIVPPSP
jgi:hypothetical protein